MTRAPQRTTRRRAAEPGRLAARPWQRPPHAGPGLRGLQPLRFKTNREGLLYVPAGYDTDRPAPLVLMLHGAGGSAEHGLAPLLQLADAYGLVLLSPASHRETWDIIAGSYGPDTAFIDRVLSHTFDRYAVDPSRIAVAGFSDGASYALSVGITNGDLFTHVIAFSPGFMAPAAQHGSPRIFISHGRSDRVLPIDVCSRRIVPQLERVGYDVLYREFDGGHDVPAVIAREAADWFTAGEFIDGVR